MKVHIVSGTYLEGSSEILGAFLTREEAKRFAHQEFGLSSFDGMDISEVEVGDGLGVRYTKATTEHIL